MAAQAGPCEGSGWDAYVACCADWESGEESGEESLHAQAKAMAELVVWAISGRQFGLCDRTVRPCGPPRRGSLWWEVNSQAMGSGWMTPYMSGGQWLNAVCGCSRSCSCTELGGIMLPGPVESVESVTLDGVDFTDFAMVGGKLVRTDGELWPLCQNMALPDTEVGTWSVTYSQGIPVPAGGNLAAGKLACELVKACAGEECALPSRVTDITREGVTMTLLDPLDFLEDGRTGITLVDQWVAAVNPYGHRAPPSVWSPDLQQVQVYG